MFGEDTPEHVRKVGKHHTRLGVGDMTDGWKLTNNREAQKEVQNIALDTNFSIPGDPGFPLNQMFQPPASRQEAETLKQYLSQVRQELAIRLLARVFEDPSAGPSKWWLSFTKRKFMGKSL